MGNYLQHTVRTDATRM